MRTMPKITDPLGIDESIAVPSVPSDEWHRFVACCIGRAITDDESRAIEKMAAHNWTARIVAEKIIGRDLTTEEVAAAHEAMKK